MLQCARQADAERTKPRNKHRPTFNSVVQRHIHVYMYFHIYIYTQYTHTFRRTGNYSVSSPSSGTVSFRVHQQYHAALERGKVGKGMGKSDGYEVWQLWPIPLLVMYFELFGVDRSSPLCSCFLTPGK